MEKVLAERRRYQGEKWRQGDLPRPCPCVPDILLCKRLFGNGSNVRLRTGEVRLRQRNVFVR